MNILLLCLAIIFLPLSVSAAETYAEKRAERPDGSYINYYLLQGDKQVPSDVLLLIMQGSDCNSVLKNKAVLSDFKHAWPEADVLLIEKYGIDQSLPLSPDTERHDCPREYLQNDNPEQRVADIERVLKAVRSNGAYPDLILLGGSEGAVIANLMASRLDRVTAAIAFNGGGRWFIDDVIHSIASGAGNPGEAEAAIQGFKGFAEHVLNSAPSELVVSGHGYSWWYQMLGIDQLAELQKVEVPLLLVQGGRDSVVSVAKVDEMVSALLKQGKDNIDYRVYAGLDHRFNGEDGESQRSHVVLDMQEWLKGKMGGS